MKSSKYLLITVFIFLAAIIYFLISGSSILMVILNTWLVIIVWLALSFLAWVFSDKIASLNCLSKKNKA